MELTDAFEPLCIDQYAKRLKVGRTTIFKWKEEGALVPGRHFFKRGKIVRYIWARDLIMELHENTENKSKTVHQQGVGSTTKSHKAKKESTINLEY
jgi:hypothetical protein